MKVFLLSIDYDVWNNIEFGYHEPAIKIENREVIIARDKQNATKKKIFSINAKDINAL